jgi:choline-sulfatase
METQPNILLIMADQMAAPFMAPWGGPAIAPAIDRLAAEGVVFESTYSNSPLCAPARFAMMAGQQNSKIGAYDNASEFASTVPTFAHYMRSAGYQTSLAG